MSILEPSPPRDLALLERWFAGVITRPFRGEGELRLPNYEHELRLTIAEKIAPGPKLTPHERIGIYHQQYWWRLFVMLQEQYPTLVRLFGYGDFNVFFAEPYLLQYPPSTWFIPHLGRCFPQWIQTHYKEEDSSFVFAVAQLDEIHERLLHGTQDAALLELEGDLFLFRERLLEKPVDAWMNTELPPIDWFPHKRSFRIYRTEEGIFHELYSP
jgi:hypothetical protein